MTKKKEIDFAIARALRNIEVYGDTDILPFPFEKHLFEDLHSDCAEVLRSWHNSFEDSLEKIPPVVVTAFSPAGYFGFRRVTGIEPFWNAYYLALVISLADRIESVRIPREEQIVYSYRYGWNDDTKSLFQDSTWHIYRKRCAELAAANEYVVLTDISDFYPRVNHHRLQNALQRLSPNHDVPSRIIRLLERFSNRQSYGLPVGGPASRMLAELSLSGVDKQLRRRRIVYCRYADDFAIFCSTVSDAYKALATLSEFLAHEGLSLQKSKTRILKSGEFMQIHRHLDPESEGSPEQRLLGISLKFDPYSPTADEEYMALRDSVAEINIVQIIANEISKTQIDPTVTRQALNALRVISPSDRDAVLKVLFEEENLGLLAPIFPHLIRVVRGLYEDLDDSTKDFIDSALLELADTKSHLMSIDVNRCYIVELLSRRHSPEKEQTLSEMYEESRNPLLCRMIVHTHANWNCYDFISAQIPHFNSMSLWERRALLIGSLCLGDEGKHWRSHKGGEFNEIEKTIQCWAGDRKSNNRAIPV